MIRGLIILLMLSGTMFAQQNLSDRPLERMFYSVPYQRLEEGILETSRKHALYSYIIANLGTPYFDIVNALPPEDRRELSLVVSAEDQTLDKKVIAEFVLAKFAKNSKRYTAMITMWGGKKASLNKIASLGK